MKKVIVLLALAVVCFSCETEEQTTPIVFENQAEFNLTPELLEELQDAALNAIGNCSECVECIQVCSGTNGGQTLSYCCDGGDQ